MCNNCNQNNCGGCNQEMHICNQCQPEETCSCPIIDLSTECVLYNQDNIECNSVVVVAKNTILSDALSNIVSWSCTKFYELANYLRIVNVGTGVSIYAGDNLIGEKKLRKINSASPIITVTQNTNDISLGIDPTSLDTFIEGNQKTYTISNTGTGAQTYKDSTVVGNNTQFNLRKVNTSNSGTGEGILKTQVENTNDITILGKSLISSDNSVIITADINEIDLTIYTAPDTGIPRFTVNKDYTGDTETGSISQPFKSIGNALTAFVGTGTALSPEFGGATVYIQKATTHYAYTGSLEFNGLFLEVESGATIVSNPLVGDYLANYDNLNGLLSIDSTIILNENSEIQLVKKGFKNRGTTGIYSAYSKILRVKGSGTIRNLSAPIAGASIKTIFESNYESTVGYNNPAAATFAVVGVNLISYNSPILMQGGSSTNIFNDIYLEYCSPSGLLMNSLTPLFDLKGGNLQINNLNGLIQADSVAETVENVFLTEELNGFNITIYLTNSQLAGVCDNLFYNKSTTELNTLDFTKLTTGSLSINSLFVKTATPTPQPASLHFCSINGGVATVSDAELVIINNSINELSSQMIATLPIYTSKNAAAAAGLFRNSLFINKVDVAAGLFVAGLEYKILTIGTTDFTLIGASANTVGLYFTASGTGTGTGTASLIRIDINM